MSDIIEIHVPDIGEFSDIPVIEIPVSAGDTIAVDDTLIVLESDKATLDVPATEAGEIVEFLVKEGDLVSKGGLIARLRPAAGNGKTEQPTPTDDKPAPTTLVAENQAETATINGEQPATTEQPAPKAVPPMPIAEPAALPTTPPGALIYASPSVRHHARGLGVDITKVTGTGPKGRITREDVHAFVKGQLQSPAPTSGGIATGIDIPDWPKVDYAKFGPVEHENLSRIVRISGPALTRNSIIIPHVCNFDEADVTTLEEFRKTLNSEASDSDARLSMLAFAVKAVVAALKAYPKFNSSLDGDRIVLKNYWNIGVAADTPEGLVVPVIKDADLKGLREIAGEMGELAALARAGKLKPAQMTGATFTISSLGGIGGTGFTPIINAPEVAILGMTRAGIQPVWDGNAFQPRLIQPLSLSWDHRVVDGVAAARFLRHICKTLSDFRRISI